MKKYLKIGGFGFLTWLIPFVVSMVFYTRDGQLSIDLFLFKSIMIVVGSVTGVTLMALYLRSIRHNVLAEGIMIGLLWFAINAGLDMLILVPMSKMTLAAYWGANRVALSHNSNYKHRSGLYGGNGRVEMTIHKFISLR